MDFNTLKLSTSLVLFNLLLLSALIFNGFRYYCRHDINNCIDKKNSIIYFILVLIISLTYVVGGDFFHYQDIVNLYNGFNLEGHMEPFYYSIITLVKGDYFLFRFIVWGGALLLLCLTLRKMNQSVSLGLFIFSACYITIFSYARVSLAMCVCSLGLCFLVNKHTKWYNFIVGLILVLFSNQFHDSIVVLALVSLTSLVELKKKHIYMFLIIIPLLIFILNRIISGMLDGSISFFDTNTVDSLALYQEREVGNKNWKGLLSVYLVYSTFFVPCFVVFKTMLFKINNNIDVRFKRIAQVLFLQTIIAVSFAFVGSKNMVFFYRLLYMTFPLLVLELTYIWKQKLIEIKTFKFILTLCICSQIWKYVVILMRI